MRIPLSLLFVIVAVVAIVVLIFVATATISPALSNDKECPTGSAICSTAAMMPGAVTIISTFIILTVFVSLIFVIFYIRSKS
jgi:hypothetical protein